MRQLRVVHTCLPRPIEVRTPVHSPGKSTADLYMISNTFDFEFYNTFENCYILGGGREICPPGD